VPRFYRYGHEKAIVNNNYFTVSIDRLLPEMEPTYPPTNNKRQPGRPKQTRYKSHLEEKKRSSNSPTTTPILSVTDGVSGSTLFQREDGQLEEHQLNTQTQKTTLLEGLPTQQTTEEEDQSLLEEQTTYDTFELLKLDTVTPHSDESTTVFLKPKVIVCKKKKKDMFSPLTELTTNDELDLDKKPAYKTENINEPENKIDLDLDKKPAYKTENINAPENKIEETESNPKYEEV
jgi:hypothetical protein